MTARNVSAVMVTQRTVVFGAPFTESTSRTMPTRGIRIRKGPQKATYSESGLLKMVMRKFSFQRYVERAFRKSTDWKLFYQRAGRRFPSPDESRWFPIRLQVFARRFGWRRRGLLRRSGNTRQVAPGSRRRARR